MSETTAHPLPARRPSDAGLATALAGWATTRRWYPAKGSAAAPVPEAVVPLTDPAGEARVEVHLLRLADGLLLQVPVVLRRPDEDPGPDGVLVTTADGPRLLVDGPADPAFVRAWWAAARPGEPLPPGLTTGMHVLAGEQSNTSVLLPGATPAAILKVFRAIGPGPNPDVDVPLALSGTGWRGVPRPLAWLTAAWPDGDGTAVGHLSVASELVTGAQDGFELACALARDGVRMGPLAEELGRTTAQMHRALRMAAPVAGPETTAAGEVVAVLRDRAAAAIAAAPVLADRAGAIAAVLAEIEALGQLPPLQRVHGDYHLGQALRSPERGWVVLDFEGEPAASAAERSRPDLALRDLAGMLRSFDYAAAVGGTRDPGWVEDARAHLVAGYQAETDAPPSRTLLRGLELDKALYEVAYEARNRPSWIPIPLDGVDRLLARDPAGPDPRPVPWEGVTMTTSTANHDPVPFPIAELDAIVAGTHADPHRVLGPHRVGGTVTIRALRPLADAVVVVTTDAEHPMVHEHEGVWVVAFAAPEGEAVPDYRLHTTYVDTTTVVDDPYRFLPTLGEMDLHLVAEGRHEELWTALGANVHHYPSVLGEVTGTAFAVWAPNARAVRVIGDFNHWQGRTHAMRVLGGTGVWELFVPGVRGGDRYKFELLTSDGSWHQKADPLARGTEVPPATASVVTESGHVWQDAAWLAARAEHDAHSGPMSVYEVHLGSWRPGLSYRELADQLTAHVLEMGFTHVELMPVAEHPFGGSWGYQVSSYYAPTSRFGHPDDFRFLVDRLHQAGIGVILDWVPAHFPKDEWALGRFDGTPLYEHPDPLRGEQPDWGTFVFNFGRNEVRNFLVANATYWLEEFHVDGLRVDAVASMLYLDYSRGPGQWRPNVHGGRENLEAIQFLQEANATAYRRSPGVIMIAEESTAWPGVTAPTGGGGLGFGLKWNMGWMNDTLRYLAEEPINRRYHHHEVTFSLVYAFSENFVLPLSHDEVVHGKGSLMGKMPGDHWQQAAGLRALLAYQWSHPGKQLLFMGGEFGQVSEWAESRSLDWHLLEYATHQGIARLVKDLNALYRAEPALWAIDFDPAGFEWIDAGDAGANVLSFIRRDGAGREVVVAVNFAGTPHEGYRLGLPRGGAWREAVNTDAGVYGGSGVGNLGLVHSEPVRVHAQPHSVALRLPPLGALFLVPEGQ